MKQSEQRKRNQPGAALALGILAALVLLVLSPGQTGTASADEKRVSDSFESDDSGRPITEHTPEIDAVGGGWQQPVDARFQVSADGESVLDTTVAIEERISVIDTLLTEFDLEIDISRRDPGSLAGIVLRYVDDQNFFAAVHDGQDAHLLRMLDGDRTVLDKRQLKQKEGERQRWSIRLRADSIRVSVDGRKLLEAESPELAHATKAGLLFMPQQRSCFLEFEVESDAEPVVPPDLPTPPEPLVVDTLTAPDGPLPDHTGTDTKPAGGWSQVRGEWQIVGGEASLESADPVVPFADQLAVIETGGAADREISVDITWITGTAGIAWDVADAENYSVMFWQGVSLVAGRVDNSVFRELGRQRIPWSPGERHLLKVRISGQRVRAFIDSSEAVLLGIGYPVPTVLNAGIFVRNGLSNTFDDFITRPAPANGEDDPPFDPGDPGPPVLNDPDTRAWLFDSFDSPDGLLLQNRSPEVNRPGSAWEPQGGLWQVWQAQASEQSGVFGGESQDRFAVIDTGVDEYELSTEIDWQTDRAGVLFGGRATGTVDAGRNGFIFFRNGESLEFGRLIGGVYFGMDSTTDFKWRAGQKKSLRVDVEGSSARLRLDGKPIFTFEDDALRGATWAGLFQRGRNDERFDRFAVFLPGMAEPPEPGDLSVGPISRVLIEAGEKLRVEIPLSGFSPIKPSVIASATRVQVSDLFESPGGAPESLADHIPDFPAGGDGWLQVRDGPLAEVGSGVLSVHAAADGGDQRVVIDSSTADLMVSALVTPGDGRAGLVARHDGSDADSNWVMGWFDAAAGRAFLARRLNGQFRLLAHTPFAWPAEAARAMSLETSGDEATLRIDELPVLSAVIEPELDGTFTGLFARGGAGPGIFDDFRVVSAGLPDFISLDDSDPFAPALLLAPGVADAGSYEIGVTAENVIGTAGTSFMLDVISPAGPTADAGGPYATTFGTSVLLDATESIPGESPISAYEWDVDGDGSPDLAGSIVEFTPHRTGAITVSVTVTDESGQVSTDTAIVHVAADGTVIDLSTMLLAGSARLADDTIILTPDRRARSGSAWIPSPFDAQGGFVATFSVDISSESARGADGFAFVIHGDTERPARRGLPGAGLGYTGIRNSIAIEFDNWPNRFLDETGPHVAVHSAGESFNWPGERTRLATNPLPADLFDGVLHARVALTGGVLTVSVDDFTAPVITLPLDIADLLDLDDGLAVAGFTAATGGASQRHSLVSLTFEPDE